MRMLSHLQFPITWGAFGERNGYTPIDLRPLALAKEGAKDKLKKRESHNSKR